MKRLLAPLALALSALYGFVACGDAGTSTATSAGDNPDLDVCHHAPLCDPLELPSECTSGGTSITCSSTSADAGASDAGTGEKIQTARLQCVLEALRDRKVGALNLIVSQNGSDSCGTRFEIVSFGDGSAAMLPVSYCDLDASRGSAVRRKLEPASFFADCLASTDDRQRLACIPAALTTTVATGVVCECRGINADPVRGICASQ